MTDADTKARSRLLAYTAVFHFVRQQRGWVALFHRRNPDTSRATRRVSTIRSPTGSASRSARWCWRGRRAA